MKLFEIWKNNKIQILIFGIFAIGIAIRIYMSFYHFTHIDDIGPINDILARKTVGISEIEICTNFWTYAPLQIRISSILINRNFNYQTNLILGRLPSLISGIITLFFFYKLLLRLTEDKNNTIVLVGNSLIILSWENIIYSAQMEPYEILVMWTVIVIYMVVNDCFDQWQDTIIFLIVMSLGCYSHYQFFIVAFAIYLATFITNIRNTDRIKKIVICGIGNVVLTIPLLINMLKSGMFEHTLQWNVGNGYQFLFSLPNEGLFEKIKYIIHFFASNTFLIIKYFFTIKNLTEISNIIAVLFVALVILGCIYAHKENLTLAVWMDILEVVTFVMVGKGTLAYGPSRHMLLIYSCFYLQIIFGLFFINKKYVIVGQKLNLSLAVIMLVSFFFSLPNELAQRTNYLSEDLIKRVAEEYSADFIYGFDWTSDLFLMNIDGYDNCSSPTGQGWQQIQYDENPETETFIILSRNVSIESFLSAEDGSEMKKNFTDILAEHGFNSIAGNYPNYKVVYKYEKISGIETEYASKYFGNYPNGLYLYVLTNQNGGGE